MSMLSDFCKSKELWSVRCGSAVCDASNEWSFGGPDKECSVKLPDIYLRSLGSTLDFPKKNMIIDKGIIWEYEKKSHNKLKGWMSYSLIWYAESSISLIHWCV